MKIISIISSPPVESPRPLIPTLSYPDSSMVRSGNPIFLPDFDSSFSGRFFLAVKISRLGKSVAERFAPRYYSDAAPAMAVFPDDLVGEFCTRHLPWTSAACFDRSLIAGDFCLYSSLRENRTFTFSYTGMEVFVADVPDEAALAKAIHEVSLYNSLKMGDLIIVPIDINPIQLQIDSCLAISSGDKILLKTAIK